MKSSHHHSHRDRRSRCTMSISLVWPRWFRHRTLHFMFIHSVHEIAETQKLSAATGLRPYFGIVCQPSSPLWGSCPGALGTNPTVCGVARSTCEFMSTSTTQSTMSVGLVDTLLPRPLTTAAPHSTMLPGTAARPVSTTFAFLTTSWWDPRHKQTLTDSAMRQRCRRTIIHLSRDDCIECHHDGDCHRWLRVTLWTSSGEMSRDTKTCPPWANVF